MTPPLPAPASADPVIMSSSRRSMRSVQKRTYDDDPDYLDEEDEEEEDYKPVNKVRKRMPLHGVDEVYVEKREKNNVAVRKSRMKLKVKQDEAIEKIGWMASERQTMEQDVTQLSTEISELKELLIRITSSSQSADEGKVGVIDLSNLRYFDCMK